MLCLSRTKEERIVILDEHGSLIASIIIIDIRGDKVRMGFDADSKITIHRKEVYDAIRTEHPQDRKAAVLMSLQDRIKLRAARLQSTGQDAAANPPATTEENTDAA